MPFRDPVRVLILPFGISIPPPVGESAIQLDPGPPPSIKLYTGDSAEVTPATIRTENAPNPTLVLLGPETGAGAYAAQTTIGVSSADTPYMEHFAEDFTWFDGAAVELLDLIGTDSFKPDGPKAQLGRFESTSTIMHMTHDFDDTDDNTNTNTAYATQGAGNPGLSFVAPPSGRGLIIVRAHVQINTTAAVHRIVYIAARVGTGSTIGAGTAQAYEGQTTPDDDLALAFDNCIANGTTEGNASLVMPISGLTSGDSYNIEMQQRINSATTANYDLLHRSLIWQPLY